MKPKIIEISKYLISHGIDIHARNNYSQNAYEKAKERYKGYIDVPLKLMELIAPEKAKMVKKEQLSKRNKSSYKSNTHSKSKSHNLKQFASVEFIYYGSSSIKDANLRVQSIDNTEVDVQSGKLCYLSQGARSDIRGNYKFTWRFDTNNNFLLDPKIVEVSGTFPIDGLYSNYTVSIGLHYKGSIDVKGY